MKTPTEWSNNPSSEVNQFVYDDATVDYDSSAKCYDGVVETNMSDRDIKPTDWDNVEKSPTNWSKVDKTPTVWVQA